MNTKKLNLKELYLKHKEKIIGTFVFVVFVFGLFTMLQARFGDKVIKPQDRMMVEEGGNKEISSTKSTDLDSNEIPEYDFTEAMDHVGEKAKVSGEVLRVFTAKSGVTFLDFCEDFSDCPFSAVIFASDAKKFSDVSKYQREVVITGVIKSYNGKAEIILKNPEQIE
jgi:hypothetical protein